MAMPTQPLTLEEVQILIGDKYTHIPSMWDEIMLEWMSPRYQTVRYRAAINKVDYELPDTFYGLGPTSPSDCIWMVPNTINEP